MTWLPEKCYGKQWDKLE